jgi:glyoxylase-like metal-dependent hydrolase (beta-lactamase superfamily II)
MKHLLVFCVFILLNSNDAIAIPFNTYVPVLEQTKEKFWSIDQKTGYAVQKVATDTYVMTDGIWQSAFLVTSEGVVVLDAPESYASKIPQAIKSVTSQPIKYLVYSHSHKDHIGGSATFKDIKGLKVVALSKTQEFLTEKKDPNRLIPTEVFNGHYEIKLGGREIQLKQHGNFHSNEGDLFIYLPHAKLLMAIDTLTPGYVPFKNFDLTSNFHEYLKVFDDIMEYDFEIFVGGHLTHIGSKEDVKIAKEYTLDVYNTTKRIHANTDMFAVIGNAAKTVGWDNKFLLFKVFLDKVTKDAAEELEARWINRLSGVDVFLHSHVETALIYVRWDD